MNQSPIILKDKFEAKIIENNIYFIKYFDNSIITLDDMKLSYNAYSILSKGEKMKIIIEMGDLATIEDDAREYAEKNKIPALAETLIIKTIPLRILVIMYFKFRVQKHPVKIHSKFEKGIEWLNSIN